MWTLWALAIMLAAQGGALVSLDSPPVESLPSLSPVRYVEPVPLPLPPTWGFRSPPPENTFPPRKQPPETPEGQCAPASKYFLSAEKLSEYLNATVPPEIEKLVKCEEVNIVGVLGEVLDTVETSGLINLVDITSLLEMGDGGIGGILGMGSKSADSPKLPSLSKVGETADNLGVGSLLGSGADKGPVKGLLDSADLPNLESLNDVAGSAKSLKDSAMDKVKNILPTEATDALKGALGNLDLKQFLLGLNIETVETEAINSTVTGDGIDIMATTTATIGGEGVAGPIITVMGFQVHLNISLKVVISTNNTQCISLDIEETNIHVKKVSLRILETVTDTAPLPMPLPLKDIVPKVLSVELQENVDNSESCAIVLSDFNECKNSTGLFQFHIRSSRTCPEGLSILYCVKALFDKAEVPVPGGRLPPHPKDANVSIAMSNMMVKTVVKHSAKQSSIKSENLEGSITKINTNLKTDSNSIRVVYWTTIKRNGEVFAKAESVLFVKLTGKISSGKMIVNVESSRSEHTVNPPELKDAVKGLLLKIQKSLTSGLNASTANWNIPSGVPLFPVNGNVIVTPSNDLLIAN
ncbi:PREDICTED: vomeromodulin-like [Chinchilla lanigera]|uniref:vomeromodulin-like n=1 Tax=Chinchilla lanigera TaxID=34839 RepID=UPI000697E638|nr:PREDICTED: vomeromodulin-like [Chinchilla lanigera]